MSPSDLSDFLTYFDILSRWEQRLSIKKVLENHDVNFRNFDSFLSMSLRTTLRLLATQPETRKLQQVCYHQAISGCVRIACSGLMITSLLQVVNRLVASCELHADLM